MEKVDILKKLINPNKVGISIKIAPTDVIYIDNTLWEQNKDVIKDLCLKIPPDDLCGINLIKKHTYNNDTLAKLLLALGDKLGVWERFPSTEIEWNLPHWPCANLLTTATRRSSSNNRTDD